MSLTPQQQQALLGPLNPARIASRKQGGRSLSYLEAWDVRATLIRVFGLGGFSANVTESQVLRMDRVPAKSGGEQWEVACKATMCLYIPQLDATYTETAIASQRGPDIGEVSDFAVKTAVSDALKRCAINLGTQFGLSLYDNGSTNDVVKVVLAPGQEWAQGRSMRPEPQGQNTGQGSQNQGQESSGASEGTVAPPMPPEAVQEATGVQRSADEIEKAEAFISNAMSVKDVERTEEPAEATEEQN